MPRPKKENTRKSLFGMKLSALSRGEKNIRLSEYFKIGMTALSKYLNGDSTPSMAKIQEFVLNYAADHDMQIIDLNWLMNDNDRRMGPVFVNDAQQKTSVGFATDVEAPVFDALTIADSMPRPNATLPLNIDEPKQVQRFRSPGSAAAIGAPDGPQGGFPDEHPGTWDEIVIPETTHFIQVRGDSMKPFVLDSQYVIVGPEYMPGYTYPARRDIVVVQVQIVDERRSRSESIWEGVYCKRVQDGGDTWQFTSINPAGESFTVSKANCRMWPVLGTWFAGKGRPPEED